MIATIKVTEKSFGSTVLYHDLQLTIQKGEKVALIGRNGVGKSTLFGLITGEDTDFSGEITMRKGTVVASTRQEHHDVATQTAVTYILGELPEYAQLKHVIETYPDHMGDDTKKITRFTEAIERFGNLGFYHVEDEVRTTLADYQLGDKADSPLSSLSGGERRFVELVKLTHARADLLLIDEPTNHMDFVAKDRFIQWFKSAAQAVVVITHDRDVLADVDRIVEIVDGQARSFAGNYDAYLRQNSVATVSSINDYEVALRTLENLNKQIQSVRAKKASTSKTPNPFIPLERRLLKEREKVESNLQKPSFWVDQESLGQLGDKVGAQYDRYKTKNIALQTKDPVAHRGSFLVAAEDLALGYDTRLFSDLNFTIVPGDRLELRGRNGAGKSTLIAAIMAASKGQQLPTVKKGDIKVDKKCHIGRYEQEIDAKYLHLTLGEAVEAIYRELSLPVTDQEVFRVLGNYLFDPQTDRQKQVALLSGGQKARLQLIRMFAGNPNLLILDEPTNHLDLPSIEELEQALTAFTGAILYVSHDSHFRKNMGGETIVIGK